MTEVINEGHRIPLLNALSILKSINARTSIDLSHSEEVQLQCQCMEISNKALRDIMQKMNACYDEGLHAAPGSKPSVKMLPSFVRTIPNGTEQGDYLALDLGGTNFRVILVRLIGRESEMYSKIYRISEQLMRGTGEMLFDHIAACLAKFMQYHNLTVREPLPLGFTFSFPCNQTGLDSATLVNWTKGFTATGVEGKNVIELLNDACRKRGMCVNTEWGAFGDNGELDFVRTNFDKQLDDNTINPGRQIFEKMISGMYIGELVRIVLESLARNGHLFNGHFQAVSIHNCFPTKFVSEIEGELQEDEDRQFLKTQQILEEIGVPTVTQTDCANVAYVCSVVSTRAAHLCACGIASLLERINKPYVTVGIDGSVYRFHPTFKELLDQKIDELIDEKFEFQIMLSEDGSGRGAALVAAAALRSVKGSRTSSPMQ